MRRALALLLTVAAGGAAVASTEGQDRDAHTAAVEALDAQLAVVARTDELLADKYHSRAEELEHRVRASYKLLRAGWAPLWIDAEERGAVARRRAAVRRVLSRTTAELSLLRQEVAVAARARAYLEAARTAATAAEAPAPGSLPVPVAPGDVIAQFGVYRHQDSGARLSRRGVELSSEPATPVYAVAPGVVRYAGRARGLGQVVIVAHRGFSSISGHLDDIAVRRGDQVTPDLPLGLAAGERTYLEIRLAVGAGGHPIDPAPLLAAQ